MATINFYLDRARNDGRCPIFMVYQSSGKKWKQYTKEKLLPKYWDKKKQRAKHISDAAEINDYLDYLQAKLKRVERQLRMTKEHFTIDDVQKEFLGDKPKTKEMFVFFEEQIEQLRTVRSETTYKKFKTLLSDLRGHEKYYKTKLDFEDIDANFYNKFLVYLAEGKGNSQNTVQKKITNLKSLFHKATKAGFNKKMDFLDFKLGKVKTEKVFLTKEELFNLYNLDLSDNNRLEKVRDIFCFGCFTGLRFSDISALKFLSIMTKQNVGGGEYQALNFNVYKTKDILVVPLNKYALEIIEKYRQIAIKSISAINGDVDKLLIERKVFPTISNQKMNDYIKEVAELSGINQVISLTKFVGTNRIDTTHYKYELISTHAARRTFAIVSLEMGMRIEILQKILGHKTIKTTMRYVFIQEDVKNAEIQKVWK